jgi:hypothetical protein
MRATPTDVSDAFGNIWAQPESDHSWRRGIGGVFLSKLSPVPQLRIRSMMAHAKVLMAAALVLGSAVACSDVTGNNVDAQGSFFLESVNGQQVPYSYVDQNTGNQITVEGDQYRLNGDGTYNDLQTSNVNGFAQSGTEFGTWSQSGNTVFFRPTQSDFDLTPYQATVRNSSQFGGSRTLTISLNGSTAIYTD